MSAPQPQPQQQRRSVLFRLLKGFLYGNVVGLFAGSAIYLLASAVNVIAGQLPVAPQHIFMLIWGASVTAGVAKEYSEWLEGQ